MKDEKTKLLAEEIFALEKKLQDGMSKGMTKEKQEELQNEISDMMLKLTLPEMIEIDNYIQNKLIK